jgi:hypothetical protein
VTRKRDEFDDTPKPLPRKEKIEKIDEEEEVIRRIPRKKENDFIFVDIPVIEISREISSEKEELRKLKRKFKASHGFKPVGLSIEKLREIIQKEEENGSTR